MKLGLSDLKFGCSVAEKTESSLELGIGVFFAGFPEEVPKKTNIFTKETSPFPTGFRARTK